MAGQIYQDKNLNNNKLTEVGSIEITADAENASHAVRKSQAEAIANTTTQAAIVNSLASPSDTTALDTQQLKNQLDTKQDNLSIKPDSTLYLTLVDSVLGFTNLGRGPILKDTTSANFAAFLASCTFNGDGTITVGGTVYDSGTQIFLTASTVPKETVYIYTGGNAGTADDFINDSDKYDASEVRALLSVTGVGIGYDSNTGVFNLVFGTGASDLGGQTIPHGATFTVISPDSDTADAMEKLEAFAVSVQSSANANNTALETRLNNLSGVTGSNMGTFTGGLFADNQNIKQLLQVSETAHESATSDRAAIRSEAVSRASVVDAAITSEANTRSSADTTLQNNIDSEAVTRATADAGLQSSLTNEAITRSSADSTLQSNIDSEEALRVSADSTLQLNINAEATARTVADDALQDQINSLADSNIELAGTVDGSGVFNSVDGASDSRNGQSFVSIGMKAGEEVVFSASVTLLGNDFKLNDKLMVKVATITAGAMALTDFVYKKGDGSDITRANLGSSTVDLNSSDQLRVKPDSIGRDELDSSIEADVDDKVSLTADAQTITGKGLKIEQSDSELGSSYGLYLKKTQTGSGALTGTARGLLIENWVESNGSGNPALPCYAHNTITSHYGGDAVDLSVVLAGAYCEANAKSTSAINAIGSYSVATDAQLGVNIGAFAAAENGATSNVSMLAYASTDGVGADRGVVGAVTSQSLAVYSASRVADPFPYNDIAIVADAKYAPAGSKAFYSYGDVVMQGGTVSVPSATVDASAVNLGDIKALCEIHQFDLSSGSKVITTALDLTKVKPAEFMHSTSGVTIGFTYNTSSSEVTVTATGDNVASLTSVKMFLDELPCAITNS
ncbi:hypothetical protein NVP1061O_20 [Vibrio phage 1.061.O._10N.286.55.C2]|nr:hypothetical protein NVP1061O_20 [Vibrio phage 1.061.O._10N.286.55.C2]